MMRYQSDSATALGIMLLAILAWMVSGLTLALVALSNRELLCQSHFDRLRGTTDGYRNEEARREEEA